MDVGMRYSQMPVKQFICEYRIPAVLLLARGWHFT